MTTAEKFASEPPVVRMPRAVVGIADDLAEPGHDVRLELREPGRRSEDADVAVRRVRDQVGDRRVRKPAARDVGEVSRPRRVETLRDDLLEEKVQAAPRRAAPSPAAAPRSDRARSAPPSGLAEGCRGSDFDVARGCARSRPRSAGAAPGGESRAFGQPRSSVSRERCIFRDLLAPLPAERMG